MVRTMVRRVHGPCREGGRQRQLSCLQRDRPGGHLGREPAKLLRDCGRHLLRLPALVRKWFQGRREVWGQSLPHVAHGLSYSLTCTSGQRGLLWIPPSMA